MTEPPRHESASESVTGTSRDVSPRGLWELAMIFLRLGTTAFGGPAAHIAMMEHEFVRRRNWLAATEFLDMMAVANCIPGPSSTEVAIFVGYRRAGLRGLVIAGTCFILPAAFLVTAIAWAYLHFGGLPVTDAILKGIKPVVIAVILQAMWRLGKAAIKTWLLALVGVGAVVASYVGTNALLVLLGAGAMVGLVRWVGQRGHAAGKTLPLLAWPSWLAYREAGSTTAAAGAATSAGAAGVASVSVGLWPLFLVFLKVGAVLFGSGYVLLAFLQSDLVEQRHWMTQGQLLDAVAVGQVTPGPVFTTATFIGYLLAGPGGAAVATVAIFLPAFFFVAISSPLLPLLRKSPLASAFLDGLNVASLALIAVVTWHLGRAALTDGLTITIAVVSAVLLVWKQINSAWLVVAGGMFGMVLFGKLW